MSIESSQRKKAGVRASDVTRAARALVKAGCKISRAEFDLHGGFTLICAEPDAPADNADEPGDWEKRLRENRGWAA